MTVQLGLGARGAIGLVINIGNPASSSAWPLVWSSPNYPLPTILYQFKGAPDQTSMVTNIGSAAGSYDGYAYGVATLPDHDAVRGAIFRGQNSSGTVADGVATGYPLSTTGTFYYAVNNQRFVSDRDGVTATVFQRSGYHNSPRSYMAHYFSFGRFVWGSGTSTHIDGNWTDAARLGLSPGKAYLNGTLVNGAMNASWLNQSVMFGGTYFVNNWNGGNWFCCDVPLFAYWSTPISDAQMAAWDAAVVSQLAL